MPVGRTHREAPEIDGVVRVSNTNALPGTIVTADVVSAAGPDLAAEAA